MFKKLLIANRGEIAVRVIRACREMRIGTVAIYSEADAHAMHLRQADEALLIGPAPSSHSYLRGERIVEAALRTGCEAVHPGYGFLAENPNFARMVQDAGLTFIGPSPEAIRKMGNKVEARAIAVAAGVPVVPGSNPGGDEELTQAAVSIGYPVMVKASAGGGGKGMRIVRSTEDLPDALEAARREASGAFGDDRLYLEKYLESSRHVEVQVMGDRHGDLVHLYERDCSVQRRYQKIIEESPSPALLPETRAAMGPAAIAVARAVEYENAGTVEFIVDERTGQFYFLEMNTRLQVEHPVTEMVLGLDLVKAQLRIAAGERLPFHQGSVMQRGHAIECRVYAEDPARGFLPDAGTLRLAVEPRAPGVRVDTGVQSGDEVPIHYDPLIAKVIALAEDRESAIARLSQALQDYPLLGVTTNIEFLQAILQHPTFIAGRATAQFVDREFAGWAPRGEALPAEVLMLAVMAEVADRAQPRQFGPDGAAPELHNPWDVTDSFRPGGG